MDRKFPRTTYANVAATLALAVSLSGTAYAAATIRSGDIVDGQVKTRDLAKNAVKSAKVKDGSLLRKDLKAGQADPIAYHARETDPSFQNLPTSTPVQLGSINVPAGKYVVFAKALVNSNTDAFSKIFCSLTGSDEVDDFSDGLTMGSATTDDREIISLAIAPTFATAGTIALTCTSELTSANAGKIAITAIKVGQLTNTVIVQ
ncbi:MAG TPA: hypothetical protein VLI04_02980 [Nocardioidaceae bacterium]|nr:hypothetical protein [Nocardioidaceae bacterium]